MKSISLEEVKTIQCKVLVAIDKYCNDNSITYSIACGTLLGAIRHKGYIPWDDDIDIYMLREDYNIFITRFPYIYAGKYKIACMERNKEWSRTYAKAYDDTTLFIESTKNKVQLGIGIDIFPIDQVPDDEDEWRKYDKWRRYVQNFKYSLKDTPLLKNHSLWKIGVLMIARFLFFWLTAKKMCIYLNKLAQKYNDIPRVWVFENSLGMLVQKPFRRNLFENITYIPFEKYQFKAFVDYDEYLKNAYGDYMILPPVEKRISHHSFRAYFK